MMKHFTITLAFVMLLATVYCHKDGIKVGDAIQQKRFLFEDGISPSQETQLKEGLNVAKHLADTIYKQEFSAALIQVSKAVSGFLGAISPIVGFVLSFLGGDSPELQAIRKLFTAVENGFDRIDVQFAQVQRQVAFVATQVHFTDLEANINAVHGELMTLSKVSNTNGYNYEKKEFIKTFDRTYESSGKKLFDGIVHGGLTTGGIFQEFVDYTQYDRKATQTFMLGTMNLLMRAAALEMTYSTLNHDPNIDTKKQQWVSRFNQVKSKMAAVDDENFKHYKSAMANDVNNFASLKPKGSLSNTEFSKQLFHKLTTKVILWMFFRYGLYLNFYCKIYTVCV